MNSAWTEEARVGSLIVRVVQNEVAARLLYQAQIHIINFRASAQRLETEFDDVGYHDFAQSQTCHFSGGLFSADMHIAERETAKLKTWGALMNTVTAAHRFLRSVINARTNDRGRDFASLRPLLRHLPDDIKLVRDALEHLDEAVNGRAVALLSDCNFSRHGVLTINAKGGSRRFDFTPAGLKGIDDVWVAVVRLLDARDVIERCRV